MHPKATDPMQLSADDVLSIPVPPHLRGYELENAESAKNGCGHREASPSAAGTGSFRTSVVEIDSSERRPVIEQRRIQDYLETGVRLLWVIHTATRSATVYKADGTVRLVREDGQLAGDDVLPGLRVDLTEAFRTD
jgi:hypothetical protein